MPKDSYSKVVTPESTLERACPRCGHVTRAFDRVCPQCGKRLDRGLSTGMKIFIAIVVIAVSLILIHGFACALGLWSFGC